LLGPPNLPAAITARLHDEVVRILNSGEVQQVLSDNGLDTIANTPSDFAAMIKEDAKIWGAAAASAGLLAQ
jgi:tripartite-type tricarboxylate transporter receptor subunit TctC